MGHLYTPKEALQVGMVHKLAPDADAAREECTKMLKKLMANDPWGVAESKKSLRYYRMHQFCFFKDISRIFSHSGRTSWSGSSPAARRTSTTTSRPSLRQRSRRRSERILSP